MKKILFPSIFIFSLILSLIVLFYFPISFIDYNFALINNKEDILKKSESPKIIFISGSSLFFGLSADTISKEMKIPTVNMGVYLGFGLNYMLDRVKPYIQKNDIVIISPEYQLLFEDDFEMVKNQGIIQIALTNPIGHLKYIDIIKSIDKLPKSYLTIIQFKFNNLRLIIDDLIKNKRFPDKSYFTYGVLKWENDLTESGDSIKNKFIKPNPKLEGRLTFPKNLNKNQLKEINDFGNFVKKNEAKVYFMFSNLENEEYLKNENHIQSYYNYLKNNLNFEVLVNPEELKFPYIYYYDQVNHLNSVGRKYYTKKIIKILNTKIKNVIKE